MKAISAGIVLALLTFACGQRSKEHSVVQSIASTANDQLIADVETAQNRDGELRLSAVLLQKEHYGLSDKEVKIIRDTFSEAELARLVLHFVDPNSKRGAASVRWAFIPQVSDDAKELKSIAVVDKYGNDQLIDGTINPDKVAFPLITLGYSEKIEGAVQLKLADAQPATEGALMLNAVEFSDVQEPWIKGDAEMYVVVNFIGKDGKGTSALVEMPSVDESDRRYETRQILHMWPQNRFQILNVAFFEHDSGYNYSELTKIFITAASTIVTSIIDPTQTTTIAIVGIVSQLAGKIIDALPDGAMTDDDDYVDQINTVEKYTPGPRIGVGSNVKAELSYYQVKVNDE